MFRFSISIFIAIATYLIEIPASAQSSNPIDIPLHGPTDTTKTRPIRTSSPKYTCSYDFETNTFCIQSFTNSPTAEIEIVNTQSFERWTSHLLDEESFISISGSTGYYEIRLFTEDKRIYFGYLFIE